MSSPSIKLESVHLHYSSVAFKERSLLTLLGSVWRRRQTTHKIQDIHALKNINVSIRSGERVGLLGHNGAGKSTFLKTVAGLYPISSGSCNVHGDIRSLFDLSMGFEPDATGRENILYRGLLLGQTPTFMRDKADEIVAFADIGEFIYQPVKVYSSGMFARVAFAVNAFVEPDLLIVDEALSVGDAFFQSKCMDKMKSLMENGVTVLFVSHDWTAIKNLCERGVLMDKGEVLMDASASEVVEEYRRMQLEARQDGIQAAAEVEPVQELPSTDNVWFRNNEVFLKNASYQRIQNGKLSFCNVQLLDEAGHPIAAAEYGQSVILRMAIDVHADAAFFGTGYHIRNEAGMELVYSDSQIEDKIVHQAKAGSRYLMDWKFRLALREGRYNIACVMSLPIDLLARKVECCDFVPCAVQFTVLTNTCEMGGYVHWPNVVHVQKV